MIETRFTERFDLDHPIASAPMALASGGRLAGAVSDAAGLIRHIPPAAEILSRVGAEAETLLASFAPGLVRKQPSRP